MSATMLKTGAYPFSDVVTSEETLREMLGQPSPGVIKKALPALDVHCRSFIALSPFLLLGTSDGAGHADVSPRGDAPGFVLVLDDHTIVLPDRPGNRRIDSLRNILLNPSVGMIFMIPGVEETLRINGRARIVRDPDVMEQLTARGKVPLLGIAVEIDEAFLHCAKALKRSRLWEAETWPAEDALVSRAQMFLDHVPAPGVTVEQVEASLAESYRKNLY